MTAMTEPVPQHLQALASANRVRLARAELKRRIFDGELTVADVLRDKPAEAATMTVYDLFAAQCRWGRARVLPMLLRLGISEAKLVGSLTERQRAVIVDALTVPEASSAYVVVGTGEGGLRLHLVATTGHVTACGKAPGRVAGQSAWGDPGAPRCATCVHIAARRGWTVDA